MSTFYQELYILLKYHLTFDNETRVVADMPFDPTAKLEEVILQRLGANLAHVTESTSLLQSGVQNFVSLLQVGLRNAKPALETPEDICEYYGLVKSVPLHFVRNIIIR